MKGSINIVSIIMVFFALMVFLFVMLLQWDIMKEEIMPELLNVTEYIEVPAETQAQLDAHETTVNNFNIPFDLMFVGILFAVFVGSIFISARAEPMGNTTLLLTLFIGGAILGLVLYYSVDIVQYFLTSYVLGLFDANLVMTTKIIDNMGAVIFIWWLVLIGANQLQKFIPEEFVE